MSGWAFEPLVKSLDKNYSPLSKITLESTINSLIETSKDFQTRNFFDLES